MKLAIVADWLTTYGGAEHTIAEFHAIWPDAPIFTTVMRRDALGPLAQAHIRTGPLQRWYRIVRQHQLLLPWMPRVLEDIDLGGFDVILSSSHAVAKGVIPPPHALHVCYCHTPMRYAWEMEERYLEDFRVPRWLRPQARRALRALRRWDLTTAKRVDRFIANSTETQTRIQNIYGRESEVIPPPVAERFFHESTVPPADRTSFLAIGRLVPYKRFDLLIALANELALPLTIAGSGQQEARLRAIAGPTVTFTGYVPEGELPRLYAVSKALLFPPLEDAGIVPLEAQACGTPVIAFAEGGARDTVREGETGIFFREQSVASLKESLARFREWTFDPVSIRDHARQFSATGFREKIRQTVEQLRRERGYDGRHAPQSPLAQR
ncbi:MAG: group 1 glycosyl transferase [Candidatus Peregrinibacteria bacterium Greene0416_19]|nr:MAG: group 1 glycosyl transferase [Candidatus Peregrinibacteria bacterium Greene0416_19]